MLILASLIASPALAQVAPGFAPEVSGRVAIDSDDRLRGYSISAGHPVASAMADLELPSGIYASLSGTLRLRDEDVRFLGWQANIGIARRIGPQLSLDAGVQRIQYRGAYGTIAGTHYTELYVGLTRGLISARVYYSPDYLRPGTSTVYGEAEATLAPAGGVLLNGHVGVLTYVGSGATRYDWRLGLTRPFGRFEVHAAVSGGGPGEQLYYGQPHGRTALTVGGAWTF